MYDFLSPTDPNKMNDPGWAEYWDNNDASRHAIYLRQDWYAESKGGYDDVFTPAIHEMWHQVQAWVSVNLRKQPSKLDWEANNRYADEFFNEDRLYFQDTSACPHDCSPSEALSIHGAEFTMEVGPDDPIAYDWGIDPLHYAYFRNLIAEINSSVGAPPYQGYR